MNILVVEDNEDNLALAVKVLEHGGHTVAIARTGGEALRQASLSMPDLVLMDLGLPGIDGWETTRQMRSQPQMAAVPIIALTAHAVRPEDRRRAAEAGCTDYITKPFDRKRLLEAIEQHRPAKSSSAPNRDRGSGAN